MLIQRFVWFHQFCSIGLMILVFRCKPFYFCFPDLSFLKWRRQSSYDSQQFIIHLHAMFCIVSHHNTLFSVFTLKLPLFKFNLLVIRHFYILSATIAILIYDLSACVDVDISTSTRVFIAIFLLLFQKVNLISISASLYHSEVLNCLPFVSLQQQNHFKMFNSVLYWLRIDRKCKKSTIAHFWWYYLAVACCWSFFSYAFFPPLNKSLNHIICQRIVFARWSTLTTSIGRENVKGKSKSKLKTFST